MISDEIYELCLPVLQDTTLEGDERTDKLEQLVQTELSLSGQALEDTVLNILWRFRDAATSSIRSPIVRHTIIRKSSPAPWQISRPQSSLASPTLSTASPTARPSRPGFIRAKSNGANSFSSPRPSPGLAFAAPVPHSPQLDSYQFSEPGDSQNDYGEYGSDNVDWLLNEDTRSRPSSAGTGSLYEARTSRSPTLWAESQQTDMTPYDMLRSVLGDGRSDSEIESALAANGYDLSMTIMSLMASQKLDQQDDNTPSQTTGEYLVGKSMISRQPATVSQSKRGRSPIVCKYWLSQNGNCLRADCRFSHDLSNHICK